MIKRLLISLLVMVIALLPINSFSVATKLILLRINSKTAYVNFQPVQLDIAPIETKGRTLVPLRFLSEHFGAKKITYLPETKEISLELEDVVALRTENTNLTKEVSGLKTEIDTLKNRIKELEGRIPNPTIQPPTAPSNLFGYISNKQVMLSWNSSSQGTNPIAGYKVYRSEETNGNFTIIAALPSSFLTFSDEQIVDGKTYIYYVKAYDSSYPYNESAESNRYTIQIPAPTPPPDQPPKTNPPSSPSNLQGSLLNNTVSLSWTASNAGTKPIAGYKVYRASDGSSYFSVITSLSPYAISYSDTQLTEGRAYSYYVTAFDSATPPNESAASNTVTVTLKSTSSDDVIVYVTSSGKKYHKEGCKYLSSSKIPITLKEAKAKGYTPCSVCLPPTLNEQNIIQAQTVSGILIVLKINSKTAYVNNQPVTLDIAPIEIKGRTLVPLRFLSEHFGAKKITYIPETEEIAIELEDPTELSQENTRLSSEVASLKSEVDTLKKRIQELEGQNPDPTNKPPSAPIDLQGFVIEGKAYLTWKPATPGSNVIAGYKVFRREQGFGEFILISFLPDSSITFHDPQTQAGKTYTYYIKTFDTGSPSLESVESNQVTLTIPTEQAPPTPPTETTPLEVTYLDVGQGDSILIRTKNTTILMDGGEARANVADRLLEMGISRINLMIATHPDTDHIGGLYDVMTKLVVDEVIDSGVTSTSKTYLKYMGYIIDHSKKLTLGRDGDKRNIDGVEMALINPAPPITTEPNDNSIALTLSAGKINYLFMADAGITTEKQILVRYPNLDCTILKVGHHGSIYSSGVDFLKQVTPQESVVSVGKNSYGHPSEDVLQRLREVGSKIHRTDQLGSINISTDGITYMVKPLETDIIKSINRRMTNEKSNGQHFSFTFCICL